MSVARFAQPTIAPPRNTTLLGDDEFAELAAAVLGTSQLLIIGASSVGKSMVARAVADAVAAPGVADRVHIMQLHPGSTHEDLVGRLGARAVDGQRVWRHIEGPLVALADAVRSDGARRVLVLDDLHHVDIPTFFGEAYVLLDAREGSNGSTSMQLPNGTWLSLPRDLAIIATALPPTVGAAGVDISWRRRFAQVHLPASGEVLARHYERAVNDVPDLVSGFEWMNVLLEAAFGAAYTIGHGVFMVDHMTPARFRQICHHQIEPLLVATTHGHPVANRLVPTLLWPSLTA
jgi:hypothetical protein